MAEPLDGRVQVFTRTRAEPPIDPIRALAPQASAHYGRTIALDGPWMLMVEPETHAVLVHDLRTLPAPTELSSFGRRGSGLGRYLQPRGIALETASRTAWITDPSLATLDEVGIRIDPGLHQPAPWRGGLVRRVDLRAWKRNPAASRRSSIRRQWP